MLGIVLFCIALLVVAGGVAYLLNKYEGGLPPTLQNEIRQELSRGLSAF